MVLNRTVGTHNRQTGLFLMKLLENFRKSSEIQKKKTDVKTVYDFFINILKIRKILGKCP